MELFDYRLDPPTEPATVICDGCDMGFLPCDADCGPDCPGGHAHVLCEGTGRLARSIKGFETKEYDIELERGL